MHGCGMAGSGRGAGRSSLTKRSAGRAPVALWSRWLAVSSSQRRSAPVSTSPNSSSRRPARNDLRTPTERRFSTRPFPACGLRTARSQAVPLGEQQVGAVDLRLPPRPPPGDRRLAVVDHHLARHAAKNSNAAGAHHQPVLSGTRPASARRVEHPAVAEHHHEVTGPPPHRADPDRARTTNPPAAPSRPGANTSVRNAGPGRRARIAPSTARHNVR